MFKVFGAAGCRLAHPCRLIGKATEACFRASKSVGVTCCGDMCPSSVSSGISLVVQRWAAFEPELVPHMQVFFLELHHVKCLYQLVLRIRAYVKSHLSSRVLTFPHSQLLLLFATCVVLSWTQHPALSMIVGTLALHLHIHACSCVLVQPCVCVVPL